MTCTRCECSGFLNNFAFPDDVIELDAHEKLTWLESQQGCNAFEDIAVCDCCGNGEAWYGLPGEHYGADDREGPNGPYAYNGGLCECH